MLGEERAIAPVLARPEEEDLHAGLAAFLMGGDHVGFLQPFGIDPLLGGHGRDGADPVAQARGLLKIKRLRRFGHVLLKLFPERIGFAA